MVYPIDISLFRYSTTLGLDIIMHRYDSTSSGAPPCSDPSQQLSQQQQLQESSSNSVPKLRSTASHSGYLVNAWIPEDTLMNGGSYPQVPSSSHRPSPSHMALPASSSSQSASSSSRSFWSVVMNTDVAPTPSSTSRIRKRRASSEERPFACDRCTSRFVLKGHLAQHIKYVHLKVRPHSCIVPGCDSSFGTQFARNQHHWTVHQGRKPFACACGTRFGQRSHLNRHAKRCNQS